MRNREEREKRPPWPPRGRRNGKEGTRGDRDGEMEGKERTPPPPGAALGIWVSS